MITDGKTIRIRLPFTVTVVYSITFLMLFVRLFINKGFSSQDVPVVLQCLEEMLKKRRKQVGKLHRLEI